MGAMSTAVVFEQPGKMALRPVQLPEPHSTDCVVEVRWTGISTGTERLLWDGRMPPFPGLAYPLVPGYESVGTVIEPGKDTGTGKPVSAFLYREAEASPTCTACLVVPRSRWLCPPIA